MPLRSLTGLVCWWRDLKTFQNHRDPNFICDRYSDWHYSVIRLSNTTSSLPAHADLNWKKKKKSKVMFIILFFFQTSFRLWGQIPKWRTGRCSAGPARLAGESILPFTRRVHWPSMQLRCTQPFLQPTLAVGAMLPIIWPISDPSAHGRARSDVLYPFYPFLPWGPTGDHPARPPPHSNLLLLMATGSILDSHSHVGGTVKPLISQIGKDLGRRSVFHW